MQSLLTLFSTSFARLSSHRRILFCTVLAIVVLTVIALSNIKLGEDIGAMIPDRDPAVTRDFQYLRNAPFVEKVFIHLSGNDDVPRRELIDSADRLASQMKPPLFDRVVTGVRIPDPAGVALVFSRAAPLMATEGDIENLKKRLGADGIRRELQALRGSLETPEGWMMKALFQEDPLRLYASGLTKLSSLNFLGRVDVRDNHFVSRDGKHLLMIAQTPVKITDSRGSVKLGNSLRGLIKEYLPAGITASFLSGHLYTAINSETVRKDLFAIFTTVSVAILVLLLAFMRNWRAVFVYFVPLIVVAVATAVVALADRTISAMTIAFGSVLMGISDDYPIYVYFSLRNRRDPGRFIASVARPVLISGITTMATFATLFLSDLPGQRQIAYFSMIGIAVSLILSLVVLPHFVPAGGSRLVETVPQRAPMDGFRRKIIIVIWLLSMALCGWQMTNLNFNGDMRAVRMVSEEIRKTEEGLQRVFGDFRSHGMALVKAPSLEGALAKNDRLYEALRRTFPPGEIKSIAPVLPSSATQEASWRNWSDLWSEAKRNKVRDLISTESNSLGFNPGVFSAFFARLTQKPAMINVETYRAAGLGDLFESFIQKDAEGYRVLTYLPDTDGASSFFAGRQSPDGAVFISQKRFSESMSRAMTDNFFRYILFSSLVMVAALAFFFRNVKKVLLALIPVATGMVFMFGTMGLCGIDFNIFNIIATILVIGLGVDLGIFMVSRVTGSVDKDTILAVVLSGSTSLVGLGSLMIARHPSLHSIGVTVFLGMCGAIPAAVFVIPAFYGKGPSESA